jgi:hypothetical protein
MIRSSESPELPSAVVGIGDEAAATEIFDRDDDVAVSDVVVALVVVLRGFADDRF